MGITFAFFEVVKGFHCFGRSNSLWKMNFNFINGFIWSSLWQADGAFCSFGGAGDDPFGDDGLNPDRLF